MAQHHGAEAAVGVELWCTTEVFNPQQGLPSWEWVRQFFRRRSHTPKAAPAKLFMEAYSCLDSTAPAFVAAVDCEVARQDEKGIRVDYMHHFNHKAFFDNTWHISSKQRQRTKNVPFEISCSDYHTLYKSSLSAVLSNIIGGGGGLKFDDTFLANEKSRAMIT